MKKGLKNGLTLILPVAVALCSATCKKVNVLPNDDLQQTASLAGTLDVRILPSILDRSVAHPGTLSSDTTVVLTMARGEYEHFQVYLETSLEQSHEFEFGQIGQGLLERSVRCVEPVSGYPDALVPFSSGAGTPSTQKHLWVTYKALHNAVPGTYQDTLVLKSGTNTENVKITVVIKPQNIPITPTFPIVFGVISDRLPNQGTAAALSAEKEKWGTLLLDYGISPYFSTWLSGTMQHEASSSPWAWDDGRTLSFLTDVRFSRVALPYHSLNHHSTTELSDMLNWADNNGLIGKSYFYLWDEPTLTSQYANIQGYSSHIRNIAPQANILTTFHAGPADGPDQGNLFAPFWLWSGYTNIFTMSTAAFWASEHDAWVARWHMNNNKPQNAPFNSELWTYVCNTPDDDQPNLFLTKSGFDHRAVMWRVWNDPVEGFLYWAVNSYGVSGGNIDFNAGLPLGDGALIYPGHVFGVSDPVASIRLERFRDGREDMELLRMLAIKLDDDINKTNAKLVSQRVYTAPRSFTKSALDVDLFRQELFLQLN